MLTSPLEQIKATSTTIDTQLAAHTDAHIVTSLPRSGRVRAARPLAEIGDCRARFPTPEALTCLAGVAPSTGQSGKTRAVGFRWDIIWRCWQNGVPYDPAKHGALQRLIQDQQPAA